MKTVWILALLCAVGCSHTERPSAPETPEVQNSPSVTLDNLVHLDAVSAGIQHPLVCGDGRDFPTGRELTFKHPLSLEPVHAVFPEGVTPPENLASKLVLRGHYQPIQNKNVYTRKRPSEDYQYFVVSSWEYRK